MNSKKSLALLAVVLILALGTVKADEKDEQLPSDLALDLKQAEENPAPSQKIIQDVQVEKAQITTSTGEQVVVAIKEEIP